MSVLAPPDPSAPAAPAPEVEVDDSVLSRAAQLRFPDLSEKRGVARVEALADHIMDTAVMRGDLEELRLSAHVNLLAARKSLQRMPGAGRTPSATREARRSAAPELAAREEHWQWVVDRCTEQINRLGGSDYDASSRLYSMFSGA